MEATTMTTISRAMKTTRLTTTKRTTLITPLCARVPIGEEMDTVTMKIIPRCVDLTEEIVVIRRSQSGTTFVR